MPEVDAPAPPSMLELKGGFSMVTNLDPEAAAVALGSTPGAVLLDVRSRMEFDYVGHPPEAVHVAWSEWPEWKVDPAFAERVTQALLQHGCAEPRAVPLFVLCRSGGRSAAAAQFLTEAGYQQVCNIDEGFEGVRDAAGHRNTVNGWRARGLPWVQT
jgi:rhodanese-related sulfurtransferase